MALVDQTIECPLCLGQKTVPHTKDKHRPYFLCQTCTLIFVPHHYHLSHKAEKAIYDQHLNHPEDINYRQFLSRLTHPLIKRLPDSAKGLDFGSGPGPTLSIMLEELGFDMAIFDPYYSKCPEVLTQKYDFITATEVVEHLAKPAAIFEQLFNLLQPYGVLGIMTKLVPQNKFFADWHYIRDPTHITFYSQKCFQILAKKYHCDLEFVGLDVVLFKRR